MSSIKRKKAVKMRGSKWHGFGSKKRHRGKGSIGGAGKAGSNKQKRTWFIRYDRDHIGKYGFKSLAKKHAKPSKLEAINLRDVQKLAGGKGDINLLEHGYGKVLATGSLTSPLIITANEFSSGAAQKIERAGGKALKI